MSKIKGLTLLAVLSIVCVVAAAQTSAVPASPATPHGPLMIRVSSGVLGARATTVELPQYPAVALQSRTKGDVILKVVVDESGKVILASPVEGDPLLVAASIEALRRFVYRPTLIDGNALRVESELGFHFSIHGKGERASGRVQYESFVPFGAEFRTPVATDKGVVVLWPEKISGSEPLLPPELMGKTGSVYLTVFIGQDGRVQDVQVIGGDPAFIAPVVAAVKQYVYKPQVVKGEPQAITTEISFHFGTAD